MLEKCLQLLAAGSSNSNLTNTRISQEMFEHPSGQLFASSGLDGRTDVNLQMHCVTFVIAYF